MLSILFKNDKSKSARNYSAKSSLAGSECSVKHIFSSTLRGMGRILLALLLLMIDDFLVKVLSTFSGLIILL